MINESPCFCRHSLSVVFCGSVFINRYNTNNCIVTTQLALLLYSSKKMTTIFWFIKLTRNRIRSNVLITNPFQLSRIQQPNPKIWNMNFTNFFINQKSITTCMTCKKMVTFGFVVSEWVVARTTDAQWSPFSLKFRTFRLGQTNWVDKFWRIRGIFGQTISTHFGTVKE